MTDRLGRSIYVSSLIHIHTKPKKKPKQTQNPTVQCDFLYVNVVGRMMHAIMFIPLLMVCISILMPFVLLCAEFNLISWILSCTSSTIIVKSISRFCSFYKHNENNAPLVLFFVLLLLLYLTDSNCTGFCSGSAGAYKTFACSLVAVADFVNLVVGGFLFSIL